MKPKLRPEAEARCGRRAGRRTLEADVDGLVGQADAGARRSRRAGRATTPHVEALAVAAEEHATARGAEGLLEARAIAPAYVEAAGDGAFGGGRRLRVGRWATTAADGHVDDRRRVGRVWRPARRSRDRRLLRRGDDAEPGAAARNSRHLHPHTDRDVAGARRRRASRSWPRAGRPTASASRLSLRSSHAAADVAVTLAGASSGSSR